MVLVLSLAMSNILLAGGWPPKNLCFNWQSARNIAFVLKAQGNLSTSSGKVKMYSINGVHDPQGSTETPIVGTGYMGTDGKFHFSYYGQQVVEVSGSNDYMLTAKGTIDPTTSPASGTLIFDWVDTASSTYYRINWPGTLTVINCSTGISAPLSLDSDAPGGTNK